MLNLREIFWLFLTIVVITIAVLVHPVHAQAPASSYAIVNDGGTVVAVIEAFGSPDWPEEPADEGHAVAIVLAWNARLKNPLGIDVGYALVRTAIAGVTVEGRGKRAGIGDAWNAVTGEFEPPVSPE